MTTSKHQQGYYHIATDPPDHLSVSSKPLPEYDIVSCAMHYSRDFFEVATEIISEPSAQERYDQLVSLAAEDGDDAYPIRWKDGISVVIFTPHGTLMSDDLLIDAYYSSWRHAHKTVTASIAH